MTARDIIARLDQKYPMLSAEGWDNPGLLVGDDRREVEKVFLTLDVTKEILEEAISWGADMIISHHPMIFSGIKQINPYDFLGEKILKMAENKIAYFAMHTNFDVCAMAEINASLLKLEEAQVLYPTDEKGGVEQGIGRVGKLPREMTLEECAGYVKEAFDLPQVKVFGDLSAIISRAAVSGGSGKSMIRPAFLMGAQVLITGDIDHHSGLDAVDQSLAIIDAGHYGTEYFFMEHVAKDIEEMKAPVTIKCARKKLPYRYI